MKHIMSITAIILASLFTVQEIRADKHEEQTVKLKKRTNPDKQIEDSPIGHRLPAVPVWCTICPSGINIPALEQNDISGYEIYTEEGNLLSSFSDEPDFISTLFSLTGSYIIRFTTEDYELVGYIEM